MRFSIREFVQLIGGMCLIAAAVTATPTQTPAPATFDVSKVDLSTISEDEIQKTIAHRNALLQQQQSSLTNQAGSLSNASADNKAAARDLQDYQKKVDALAIAAARDHDKVIAKDAAILRRDIIIGVLSLAIAVYAFLKFWLRVPFL
jgi:hypothetical protein